VATSTAPPPPDVEDLPPLRTSLLRSIGSAVGLIVFVAAVFGVIGMLGRPDTPTPVAADLPEATDDEVAVEETDDAAEDPVDEAPEPDPDPAPQPVDEAEPEEEATPEPEPEPSPTAEATEEPEPAEAEPAPEPAAPGIAPADISVQVLDGYKTDGGTAARGVAAQLRDAGYRVVAENQALSYDRTTVLWTAGHEAAARQVAAEIGAAEVREQPGNLSSSVDVHVVVGADRG
jgi:hypothetical protein